MQACWMHVAARCSSGANRIVPSEKKACLCDGVVVHYNTDMEPIELIGVSHSSRKGLLELRDES